MYTIAYNVKLEKKNEIRLGLRFKSWTGTLKPINLLYLFGPCEKLIAGAYGSQFPSINPRPFI